jgi:hypothetical protein
MMITTTTMKSQPMNPVYQILRLQWERITIEGSTIAYSGDDPHA